ncbi:hypothetical protein ACFWDI_31520 [Streptomyces sp. NPDC060064]|uniref:hypothetical protein n=1 Tax=Streptomyces sp. NPDC060064 TaxID=3347049 RepID=UPI00368A0AC9
MRTTLRVLIVPAVVVMAVTAGCSSDGGGGDRAQGKPADEICGAFAKDDSNTGLFIALGIGAAALIGTAVAVPVIRSRRRNA